MISIFMGVGIYAMVMRAFSCLNFMSFGVLSACLSVLLLCLVPSEARGGCLISWD